MPKIVISEQNLNDFKRWLVQNPAVEGRNEYDFQVPLSAILYQMPNLSENQQKLLASNIIDSNGRFLAEDANTMLNLAGRYPHILGYSYLWSGNSRNGQTFWIIQELLKKRKFEENIVPIYTLLHYSEIYGNIAGTGEIKHPNAAYAELLNEMFNPKQNHKLNGFKDEFAKNAKYFFETLDNLQLLNFDGASPEMREYINFGIINDKYRSRSKNDVIKIIDRLDEKFFTPNLIQNLAHILGDKPDTNQDTSTARTQAEKNKNILPKYYTKTLKALLNLAQQREIHDHNNYGKIKTLTRRYKEMCMEWYKANNWNDIKLHNGLIKDGYLHAIATDVKDGMAGELAPEDIKALLESDKRGYWIRKLPKNVIDATKLNLTSNQYAILYTKSDEKFSPSVAESIIHGRKITAKEKKEYADSLAAIVAAEEPQRRALMTEKETIEELRKKLDKALLIQTQKEHIEKAISDLRNAFNKIQRHFKDGIPNAQEEYLSRQAIEDTLYQCIKENYDLSLEMPKQKSLPLFGGRGAEKERREELERAIRNLNDVFYSIRLDKINLGKYARHILDDASIQQIREEKKHAQQDVNELSEQLNSMRSFARIEKDLNTLESRVQFTKNVEKELAQQTNKIKTLSAQHMGRNQTGELIRVTDDMSPEQKHRARAKNRNILKDKLASRKKKPARNLKEMLENADMDR